MLSFRSMMLAGATATLVALPAASASAQTAQAATQPGGTISAPPPSPARAEPAARSGPGQGLSSEDIVVTARRREERLQDVPVTATVMNQTQLSRYSTQTMYDVAVQVPTLTITKNGGGAVGGGQIALRGVVADVTDAALQQKVAVVIDNVQSSSGRIVSIPLVDIASTEVLLGPQSLYFGKNSPGGVVSFTSVSPTDKFEGYVRTSYGIEAKSPLFEGAVSVPVTDTLSFRVAAQYVRSDGFTTNHAVAHLSPYENQEGLIMPPTIDPAGYHTFTGRLTVRWRPTDRLDVNFKFLGSNANYNSATGGTQVVRCGPGETRPYTNNPLTGEKIPDPTGSCDPSKRIVSIVGIPAEVAATLPFGNGGVPYSNVKSFVTSLTANYTLDKITLTSVTGGYFERSKNFDDFDNSSLGQFKGAGADRENYFSQELRGVTTFDGPLNFTGGLLYSRDRRLYQQVDFFFNQYDPATNRYFDSWAHDYHTDKTYSAFASVDWKFLPTLELTAGGRYTHERKSGSVEDIYVNPNAPPVFLAQGDRLATSFGYSNFSPEITLTWKPRKNLNLYAAYKTGYLSPGITNPGVIPSSLTNSNLVFGAEKTRGGEIGIKGQFFGGKLSGDLSAFDYVFDNLQTEQFNAALSSYSTTNVGKAATRGFQAQGVAQLTRELNARASVAFTHAYYIDYTTAQCYTGQTAATGCIVSAAQPAGAQNLSGRQFAAIPKWTVNYGLSWTHPLTDAISMQLTADAYWRGRYNYDSSFGPDEIQKATTVVNLSARLFKPHGGWDASLIVRNVTNAFYIQTGNDKVGGNPGDKQGTVNDPREFVLQLTYAF